MFLHAQWRKKGEESSGSQSLHQQSLSHLHEEFSEQRSLLSSRSVFSETSWHSGHQNRSQNYNKKQCSAKAAGRSLSGRMMEQEEWCSNRQREKKERVKSVRNWKRLQGTHRCLMGQKLRDKWTAVQGDLHFSKMICKRWKVVDEMFARPLSHSACALVSFISCNNLY